MSRKGIYEVAQAARGTLHHHLGTVEWLTGMRWERSSGDQDTQGFEKTVGGDPD